MANKDANEMTKQELLDWVLDLLKKEKYNTIIEILVDKLLQKHNSAELYNTKGRAYDKINYNVEAIACYTTAISIKEHAIYYYNRGISCKKNNDITKAIEDYTKAIKIDSKLKYPYNNRGQIYTELNMYDDAITDFNTAINLDTKYPIAYNNRGYVFERMGQYEKALIDYETSIILNPEDKIPQNNINQLIEIRGSSLQLFIESLKNINITSREKSAFFRIFSTSKRDTIDKIRTVAGKDISKHIGEQVVHYTKLSVADAITSNKSKNLRYYNAIYMNDPEEGQVILDCLHKDVRLAFENANKQEEGNIYIGSFLPAKRHEDELVMWRTYGKDENQVEGAGCSITIKKEFFDEYSDNNYINPRFVSTDSSGSNISQNLFRVLYYNKNHEKDEDDKKMFECNETNEIGEYIKVLNEQLEELVNLKGKEEKDIPKNKAIDKIIYHLISEIRFFFKSSDYSFENEVRVLQYADKSSDQLKIDERTTLPKKVYIESNKEIQPFIERITLGPKVPNPKQWLYLDIAMRQNNPTLPKPVEFIISERKYQ